MTALQYWIGALLLAAVRREMRGWPGPHVHVVRYYKQKRGYRSLRFRLHSVAFHARGLS